MYFVLVILRSHVQLGTVYLFVSKISMILTCIVAYIQMKLILKWEKNK